MKLFLLIVVALTGAAVAQQPKQAVAPSAKTPAAVAPATSQSVSTVVETDSYPFPLAERDKIRDLQHEYDQIEIENQKMLVKVEQNKARQVTLVDALKVEAFQFAQAKKIDLDQYELDPGQIRFVKKKPTK